MSLMEFGKIRSGQYDVEVNLNNAGIDIDPDIVKRILGQINEDATNERAKVTFNNMRLKYISETLVPHPKNIDRRKKKVLFILGNPASRSIDKGMFYYSNKNGDRHGFWEKLAKTCLLKNFKLRTREEEARKRKDLILTGNTNNRFVIGFTTFYSLPTPTGIQGNTYCDSKGVEKFFRKMSLLERIKEEEFARIITGIKSQREVSSFANNAILITTIKSACKYLCEQNITKDRVKKWPIRGKGSGWEKLHEILAGI